MWVDSVAYRHCMHMATYLAYVALYLLTDDRLLFDFTQRSSIMKKFEIKILPQILVHMTVHKLNSKRQLPSTRRTNTFWMQSLTLFGRHHITLIACKQLFDATFCG